MDGAQDAIHLAGGKEATMFLFSALTRMLATRVYARSRLWTFWQLIQERHHFVLLPHHSSGTEGGDGKRRRDMSAKSAGIEPARQRGPRRGGGTCTTEGHTLHRQRIEATKKKEEEEEESNIHPTAIKHGLTISKWQKKTSQCVGATFLRKAD
ncbi:hypothetical protein LX32DRAFT_292225 [Colletotrichum zoysiae]|uniref:Uncharacterized protein n=1 Tax=Colletotrichum zoysiae TaxID=1216348 RepID=A0AAD9LWC1_9PEZI|nr:hypothetical protein LX32DRAFT_292225 [Colletotrichum zoysiae]